MLAKRISKMTCWRCPCITSASFRMVLLVLVCLPLLSACNNAPTSHHYSIFTFGTLVDISIYDIDKATADEAFQLLQKNFDHYHHEWSPWTKGELANINAAIAESKPIIISEDLYVLINNSIQLYQLSDGYYNPAIGKLINIWQFHRYQEEDAKPPEAEKIAALINSAPTMNNITLVENKLHSDNPDVLLNFGAFAKGYAIGLALNTLRSLGINNAIINAGGDLGTIGNKLQGTSQARPWNIGIRHPREDRIIASVEVAEGESVFTSGDYERVYTYQGQRYHHILDPTTGFPTQDAQSVTVIHSDPAYADAMVTALFVAGSNRWQELAVKAQLDYVMFIDRSGDIQMTEKMQNRVKFK